MNSPLLANATADKHTLTIKVPGFITEEQVEDCLIRTFKQALTINPKFKTDYHINMVKKKGAMTGRGFVYITNSVIYDMLLGREADGSKRVKYLEDPNWKPVDFTPSGSTSWADQEEEDELLSPPVIEEPLPPLLTMAPIPLTPEQTLLHEEKATTVTIKFEAALAHNIEKGLSHNVLKSSALLPFMTADFIKKRFEPYSQSKKMVSTKTGKGKNDYIQESYPLVKIVEQKGPRGYEKVAYVTFDPSTPDASFAFHMTRCREYTNHKTGQIFTISYTYARSRSE